MTPQPLFEYTTSVVHADLPDGKDAPFHRDTAIRVATERATSDGWTVERVALLSDIVTHSGQGGPTVLLGVTVTLVAHQADVDEVDDSATTDWDMTAVCEILRARGHYAEIEHTGGNVATIYAGPTYNTPDGPRYAAVAGPGTFEEVGYRKPVGSTYDTGVMSDQDDPLAVETGDTFTYEGNHPVNVANAIENIILRRALAGARDRTIRRDQP